MKWKERIEKYPEWYQQNLVIERERDRDRQKQPAVKARKAREQRKTRQQVKERNHRFVYQYLLEHPCVDCGEDDPDVLEFDHIEPSEKQYNVGKLASNTYGIETILAEIAKCEVVCANCHKKRTRRQQGYFDASAT